MSVYSSFQNEQGLAEMTPRQRAAANARAHRKPGFSPEGLERLRAAAHENRAWEKSTGPRTASGKARSCMNAFKGGFKSRMRAFQARRRDLGGWLSKLDVDDARAKITAAIQAMRPKKDQSV